MNYFVILLKHKCALHGLGGCKLSSWSINFTEHQASGAQSDFVSVYSTVKQNGECHILPYF